MSSIPVNLWRQNASLSTQKTKLSPQLLNLSMQINIILVCSQNENLFTLENSLYTQNTTLFSHNSSLCTQTAQKMKIKC